MGAAPTKGEVNPMMPVEHQVCSHELAKRLAELGVRQESVFWWVDGKLVCLPRRDRADHSRGTRAHRSRRPRATLNLLIGTSAALPDGTPFLMQDAEVVMLHTMVQGHGQ